MGGVKVFVLWCLLIATALNVTWTTTAAALTVPRWSHSAWLADSGASPRLFWASQDSDLYLLIEANTIGSIRLELDSLDVIVVWVDDVTGEPHIWDGHLANGTELVLDENEDYQLIGGDQNLTHTSVAFRRRWNTCDDQDITLGSDTVRISWSMHAHDPGEGGDDGAGSDLPSQKQVQLEEEQAVQGTRSLLLKTPPAPTIPETGSLQTWDVLMHNVVVSENRTSQHWCKIIRSPSSGKKKHIVAYEPLILSPSSSLVHSLILYECDVEPGFLDSSVTSPQNGASCYPQEISKDWRKCATPVATWIQGGAPKVLPDHIGIPVGPRQTYYMLQVHYENPNKKRALDNSGFRLFLTEELRRFDAGVFQTGLHVNSLHVVPPQQPSYLSAGVCDAQCTKKVVPEKGLKLVSVQLHSHQAVSGMRIRHIRGEQEMPRIVEEKKYDTTYQQERLLKEEVTLYPADQLITECIYNTTTRQFITFGGYSGREEICTAFILYYPQSSLAACETMPPVSHTLNGFGVNSFYEAHFQDILMYVLAMGPMPKIKKKVRMNETWTWEETLLELTIQDPVEFRDRNLRHHLQTLPWKDDAFARSFEHSLARGNQMVFCRATSSNYIMPINAHPFPKFVELKEETTDECARSNLLTTYSSSSTQIHIKFSHLFILLYVLLKVLN